MIVAGLGFRSAASETALADALAVSGDTADAAALADELLSSTDGGERATGVRIAASVCVPSMMGIM